MSIFVILMGRNGDTISELSPKLTTNEFVLFLRIYIFKIEYISKLYLLRYLINTHPIYRPKARKYFKVCYCLNIELTSSKIKFGSKTWDWDCQCTFCNWKSSVLL